MDLIISTAQGDAEVSLSHVHESVTVADIVRQVTGRPSPSMVRIDGRVVSTSMIALGARLFRGSRIEVGTDPTTADSSQNAPSGAITLVQVAGTGSGHRRELTPGCYRVGIARRGGVAPLTVNAVADARFDLDVREGGAVFVSARQGDLDGVSVEEPQLWTDQHLRIGSRVFRLEGAQRSDTISELTPDRTGRASLRRAERSASPIDSGIWVPDATEAPPADRAEPTSTRSNRPHDTNLDIGELVRRARTTSRLLWERRPDDPAAYVFAVGLAARRTTVPAPATHRGRRGSATATVAARTELRPATVDLHRERGMGFVGERSAVYAAARALVIQACTLHGPADLDLVILTSSKDSDRWEWVKWLPHSHPAGDVQIIHGADAVEAWADAQRTLSTVVASMLASRRTDARTLTLAVIDDAELWRGRTAPLRTLFADATFPVRFVTLTEQAADVPPVCTSIVRLSSDGTAALEVIPESRTTVDIAPSLLDEDLTVQTAQRIGRLTDPDIPVEQHEPLASSVSLMELLDLESLDGAGIRRRWRRTARDRLPQVPIGATQRRALLLDLAQDGPHMLITAAPGAGRRDLMRTIALALAASAEPSRLNLLLIDGGSGAFGPCASLAHVAGLVGSLDDHLGHRALRGVTAELRRRRSQIEQAGASSFARYQQLIDAEPLPHLVIMIDDVSGITSQSTEFLPALLELCRGSHELGVHVVAASSRPSGPVDKRLRAMAAIRVALRVGTDDESLDIIGSRDAAYISRQLPGRGLIRVGITDPVLFQAAYPSNVSGPGADPTGLSVAPFVITRQLSPLEHRLVHPVSAYTEGERVVTDMHRLVDAINAASVREEEQASAVIAAPLPANLDGPTLRDWATRIGHRRSRRLSLEFGLLDIPDEYRHEVLAWSPSIDGNLLVLGSKGSGTSSALIAIALDAANTYRPGDIHFSAIDGDEEHESLAPLRALMHCNSLTSSADAQACREIIADVAAEVSSRRANPQSAAAAPVSLLLIDNVASLLRALATSPFGEEVIAQLEEILTDGPEFGVVAAITARREVSLTDAIRQSCPLRILLRSDDDALFHQYGIRDHAIPTFVPGRGMLFPGGVEAQIVSPPANLASALARRSVTDLAMP
jgi:S-DNA-T family DNA segregation ATPase FtsK/SpoIIIE